MAVFQFLCPQGHTLEGDETLAGQACTCPTCGIMFLIPSPAPAAASSETEAAPRFNLGGGAAVSAGPIDEPPAPPLLHIPCPNGHVLEVPPEMLNEDVLCPHCNAQFILREKDSAEFKKKRQEEIERRDAQAGEAWFRWAIAIAVIVVLGLIVLIAVSSSSTPTPKTGSTDAKTE